MSSDGHPSEVPPSARLSLPTFADIAVAFGVLTPVPGPPTVVRSPAFGRAAPLFPVVGAVIGGVLLGIESFLAGGLPSMVVVALLVVVWECGTWGQLRAAEPPGSGFSLAIAAAKAAAILLLGPRTLALLFAPILGTWGVVVLAVGARDARNPARKLAPSVLFNEFAVASLLTLAALFSVAEGLGVLLGVVGAMVTVGLRVALHQRIGGMTIRWLVIGARIVEIVTLWGLVAVQRFADLF